MSAQQQSIFVIISLPHGPSTFRGLDPEFCVYPVRNVTYGEMWAASVRIKDQSINQDFNSG